MSVEAVSWVLDYAPTQSVADRLVLVVLAEHAGPAGENAWPSVSTIVCRAKLSERTVRYALKRLREQKIIAATGKTKYGTQIYAIGMVRPKTPARTAPAPDAPARVAPLPLHQLHPPPAPAAPEPLFNHPRTTHAPRQRDALWDALIEAEGNGQPVTKSERGRFNAAVKQLRDAGVAAEMIPAVAAAYREEWPKATLTATALAANWTRFAVNGHSESGAERLRRAMAERGVA